MNRQIVTFVAGLSVAIAAATNIRRCRADSDPLRQQQLVQTQARAMAVELVSAVLDVQLRQLEENGLKSLPIYRDIASMKENIAGMSSHDMEQVVQLLIEAQQADPNQRVTKLNAARAKIREVVVQLMAERQKLYRRMHVAKLSAEARQLVALQTKAHETTRLLPELRPGERERLVLATVEDQADVTKLFYQLVASLQDVSTWGGPAAAGASDGLRILRAAQVEPELKQAAQSLEKADFQQAATSQRVVLKGLSALIEKLDETQGLVDGDRAAALQLVRELIERQRAVRNQTSQMTLTERTAEPLIEQQTRLHKELSKLGLALAKYNVVESLIEQAKAASFEATASLFEEKQARAVEQQDGVIGDLTKIEKALEEGLDDGHANKSAAELAAEMDRLQQLQEQLEKAHREQIAVVNSAVAKPQAALEQEKQVAVRLAATDKIGELPSAISLRLEDAKEKVVAAERALEPNSAAKAESRQATADDALAAIRAALGQVQAQLADTRRWQKAVEVGELARAAEALERAAAAEAEVANQTRETAKNDGLPEEKAAVLAAEQADVAAVAERIAQGVEHMAPEASRLLREAAPNIAHAARALEEARSHTGQANRTSAASASAAADKASQQLTASASELRRQQGRAATELEKIADQQLVHTESARQAIEKAGQLLANSAAAALSALEQAKRKAGEALLEQLRAEGKSAEAEASSLVEQVRELRDDQQAADDTARRLTSGQAASPLPAASQQQQVADKAVDLSQSAPEQIIRPLKDAARSAATAAKETLGGAPAKAEKAREQTRAAIAEAMQEAQQLARQATQAQATAPDAAAQSKAAAAASDAQRLTEMAEKSAGEEARAARQSLQRAGDQASIAGKQLESGQITAAQAAQQQAHQGLIDAVGQLDTAIRRLAATQAEQLRVFAAQSTELGDLARQSDAGAAAAAMQAQRAAQRGAASSAQPREVVDAQNNARQKLDQGLASLAARAQQIRHDRDLALALAQLADEQQAARDAITQTAQELARPVATENDRTSQLAAAQSLQQAQRQFAAAQTATGEGAAEVSGQQEVANQPIREGLEIASQLIQRLLPKPPGEPPADDAQGREQSVQQGEKADSSQTANSRSNSQNPKSPFDLGTKMVPNSPQLTAKQIAGPQANNAAASAMAEALKGKGQPGQNEGESETPMEGASSSTAKKGGAAKGGKTASNQKAKKGDLETADAADADSRGEAGGQDAASGGQRIESEAWFARLPPSLRSAIQAKSRGKAPRGYEERLRRYFESID